MRYQSLLLLCSLLFSVATFSQQRYLVGSGGDMIPVPQGKSAQEIIKHQMRERLASPGIRCTPLLEYGNRPANYTFNVRVVFGHKDVAASWFEAPSDGTLDSVFIMPNNDTGGTDEGGNLLLRIFKSNITSLSGPGHPYPYGPGHYIAPPKVCWGYFNNANDPDQHIASSREEATDSTWISTYNLNNTPSASLNAQFPREAADTSMKSFCPLGEQLWGFNGIPVPIHPRTVSGIDLSSLGTVDLKKGDAFMLCFKVPGSHPTTPMADPPSDDPTRVEIQASQFGPDGADLSLDTSYAIRLQFRNWKFYEHANFCGPGWMSRGECFYYIWYSIRTRSDFPPYFLSIDTLGSTTVETTNRTVTAEIEDCNFYEPDRAGVMDAALHYAVAGEDGIYGPTVDVSMLLLGGNRYAGDIPKFPCGTTVRYNLTAQDSDSTVTTSPSHSYQVLSLRNRFWVADTGTTPTIGSIRNIPGTITLDTSAQGPVRTWFCPRVNSILGAPVGTNPQDDGTAGPFDIGYFPYLGDTMHYAWIGINGAIALSKTAADTIDLNGNGFYLPFTIPQFQRRSTSDQDHPDGIPRNFIAGLWADFIYADSSGKYGNIRYINLPDKFVVEWDSIGTFDRVTWNSVPDRTTFRIILHKDGGMIEMQYDDIGSYGIDTVSLIGLMCDSTDGLQTHGNILLNRNGYPVETKPRNGWNVAFVPSLLNAVHDGWNMVSAPGRSVNYDGRVLFPDAISSIFGYPGGIGYASAPQLSNGQGYWVKYNEPKSYWMPAGKLNHLAIPLTTHFWTMIGSITDTVPCANIITDPDSMIGSLLYTYNGGYTPASVIAPGRAYWVKTRCAGTLYLNSNKSTTASKAQRATGDDLSILSRIGLTTGSSSEQKLYFALEGTLTTPLSYYEMPPLPPAGSFDARFASGRMLEIYPATIPGAVHYTIQIQPNGKPLTVSWNIVNAPKGRAFTLTDGENGKLFGKIVLNGTGSMKLNSAVRQLFVSIEPGIQLPTKFALSQNYPNPFNPTTRMQLEMPKTAKVTIAAYDVLGRKVVTLLDEVKTAGYYTVEWNSTNVPSGTYFVKMVSEGFNVVKKVMVVK